jgi:hypothetical protein
VLADVVGNKLGSMEAQSQLQSAPPRAFHESVVIRDKMFFWGGRQDHFGNMYHSHLDVFCVNMLTGKLHRHSVTPPDIPTPCQQACSAVVGNTIYSYGGRFRVFPSMACNELHKLDLDDMRWRKVEVRGMKPKGRYSAGMCQLKGNLMLMGGYGPVSSRKRHPQAQYGVGYNLGGESYKANNELFEFHPTTGHWSPVITDSATPLPRQGHTLTAVDDKRAILFGGIDKTHKLFNDLWQFDYEKKVWTQILPSSSIWPKARTSHTMSTVLCDNHEIQLLLMGGFNFLDKTALDDCWLLTIRENRAIWGKVRKRESETCI